MAINISAQGRVARELLLTTVIKRDGREVPFDKARIERAIRKCFQGLGTAPYTNPLELTDQVINVITARYVNPTVENVQDAVELVLQGAGEYDAAKAYILYRDAHAKQRQVRPIPDHVKYAFDASDGYFPTQLQKFQFYDKYSRFNYDLGRRETWHETVSRAVDYLYELSGAALKPAVYQRIHRGMLDMQAMPSMRLLAMAGDAARGQNIAIYNCSYMAIDGIDAFVEALIISMSGCGVGYSVESQYVELLPRVRRQSGRNAPVFLIEDSTEGWADALRAGLLHWFNGIDIRFDYSQLRAAGAILKTKGGRASGPEPLRLMLDFARARIIARQGTVLRAIDAHDIMCAIGNASISGGVRRTALISLFDYNDHEMLTAKDGNFERENNQRWNANNSAVWPDEGVDQLVFMQRFTAMLRGGRGEPGTFNREAARHTIPARRRFVKFGTNPCGEVLLNNSQFCNLSIAIARQDDTLETLRDKVELATIIGTIQSMATDFPGLRAIWKMNCEKERLLGVDINGQMDSKISQDAGVQHTLRLHAIEINKTYASLLGINQSAAITCVKPSGNSSLLFDCAAGIHARWSPYYIRNVRINIHSPLFKVLRDAGAPMSPENGQTADNAITWVIHFPVKSPDGAITRNDRTAIEQCDYWLQVKQNWTEHNPSVTISYKPDEMLDLMKWVWTHRDVIGGMTFLPSFDAQYDQMPYVEISQAEYEQRAAEFPAIDFSKIYRYEEEDLTTAAQELACMAGYCEVDFTEGRPTPAQAE